MNIFKTKNLYFLGPQGSYAQCAMKKFVTELKIEAENIIPLNPITKILQKIDTEKNSMAVLPIENYIEGIVRETIDNIIKLNDETVKINAETVIPICHCLMSTAKNSDNIKTVLSHPQALGQCAQYISKMGFNVIETPSTSEAARLAKEKGGEFAAIASETAAKTYELNLLEKGINDEKDNKTRFILLARGTRQPQNFDKTSIFFTVDNKAGTLVNVLNIFYRYKINLLYIESRPSRKKMGEYNFCIDLEGHASDSNISSAIKLAKKITNRLVILGSYPRYKD